MSQIEQSDGGKKKKGAQKKMAIHVDFTPMVDMNMLLITFFMLCTTMIKSQTLNISLPSNEKIENEEQQSKAKNSEAITLILTTERDANGNVKSDAEGRPMNTIYYYEGKPFTADADKDGLIDPSPDGYGVLRAEKFLGNTPEGEQGIRKILHNKNKDALAKIDEQKALWREKKITDEEFQKKAKEIRNDSTLTRPVVIIKATPEASWESVITALDEMQINQISRYQIDNINQVDSALILDYQVKNPKK